MIAVLVLPGGAALTLDQLRRQITCKSVYHPIRFEPGQPGLRKRLEAVAGTEGCSGEGGDRVAIQR